METGTTRKRKTTTNQTSTSTSGAIDRERQNLEAKADTMATMVTTAIDSETARRIEKLRATKDEINRTWSNAMAQVEEVKSDKSGTSTITDDILKATIDTAMERKKIRIRDLGLVIAALATEYSDIGHKLSELKMLKTLPEDEAMIKKLEGQLETAKRDLIVAETRFYLFSSHRERDKQKARDEIARIENALQEVQTDAELHARAKLQDGEIDQNTNNLLLISDSAAKLLQNEVKETIAQIGEAELTFNDVFNQKIAAGKRLEEANTNLAHAETELAQEERILASKPSGTEEYAIQERKVVDLRKLAKELGGLQLIAAAEFQKLEAAAIALEGGIVVLISQRDDLTMLSRTLEIETSARRVSFQSFLQSSKNTANLKLAGDITSAGETTELMLFKGAAEDMVASAKMRMEILERHPRRMQDMEEVGAGMAKSFSDTRDRLNAVLEQIAEKYDIDPLAKSYLQDKQGQ